MTEETPAVTPEGWYPAGVADQERFWDGAAWTDQVRPVSSGGSGETSQYAPGWYADTNAPGTERRWDGSAWTAETRLLPAGVVAGAEPTDETAAPVPWYRRKMVLVGAGVLVGLIVLSGVINAVGGGNREVRADETAVVSEIVEEAAAAEVGVPETVGLTAKEAQALLENAGLEVEFSATSGVVIDRDNWTVLGTVPAAGATAKAGDTVVVNVEKTADAAPDENPQPAEPAPAEPAPAQPEMTLAQRNAVGSAQSYLDYSGFSRAGLSQQLTSEYGEGFEPGDAEFAIAFLEQNGQVDWNAEALESAQSYLDYSSFSRQGLFEQLTSEYGEGFTADQANFALDQIGL